MSRQSFHVRSVAAEIVNDSPTRVRQANKEQGDQDELF